MKSRPRNQGMIDNEGSVLQPRRWWRRLQAPSAGGHGESLSGICWVAVWNVLRGLTEAPLLYSRGLEIDPSAFRAVCS